MTATTAIGDNIEELENKDDAQWRRLWDGWSPSCVCTVCYILGSEDDVLLIRRRRKGFGSGKVSAPGGHLEIGETIRDCCIRETMEEVGLVVEDPVHVGLLNFKIPGNDMEGHVFVATKYSGKLEETDEATPFWNAMDALPFKDMFADDRVWLPHALRGENFILDAVCDENGTMQTYRFRLCDETSNLGRFGNDAPFTGI